MPEKTAHAWEEIVTQLTQEQDRFRVVELAHIKAERASRRDDRHDSFAGLRHIRPADAEPLSYFFSFFCKHRFIQLDNVDFDLAVPPLPMKMRDRRAACAC